METRQERRRKERERRKAAHVQAKTPHWLKEHGHWVFGVSFVLLFFLFVALTK